MFTVAIIGPDGAGKTTIARHLERSLGIAAKYVYMGVNLEASDLMLPTTRWYLLLKRRRGRRPDMVGPRDPRQARRSRRKSPLAALKSWLRLGNQIGEEMYRQLVIARYRARGLVVLFDRDFFADYYAYDIAGGGERSWTSRLHGFVLRRWYRRPDLVICLDAPAELMFSRKGEGTLDFLEARRQQYRELSKVFPEFEMLDASRSREEVVDAARRRILRFYETRNRRSERTGR